MYIVSKLCTVKASMLCSLKLTNKALSTLRCFTNKYHRQKMHIRAIQRFSYLFIYLLSLSQLHASELRLASLFKDNAVLQQNMPIQQIAEERGMTAGTISGHLIKIKKDHPEANLSYYKPKSSIFKKVESAHKKLKTKEGVSLKAIFDELKGNVSYDDIKLSLAFIM